MWNRERERERERERKKGELGNRWWWLGWGWTSVEEGMINSVGDAG